jgi:hypothetical protein
MQRSGITMVLGAAVWIAGCEGGAGGTPDAAVDPDGGTDPCLHHPGTCNLDDRNPQAPWDCCSAGRTCCALCYDADRCEFEYECRASCPETLPCTGAPGTGGLSCTYEPDAFDSTVYCPMPAGPTSQISIPCSATCETGVTCPFDAAEFGDAALCCPAGATCETGGFGLPVCRQE